METEIWKRILNLNYEASSYGNIRHIKRKKILNGNIDRYGYRYVGIGTKSMKVHRLVAFAFHGYSDNQIDHINNVKLDNRPENLQYCTAAFNAQKRSSLKVSTPPNINWHKGKKKYQVRATINGKRINIGHFTNIQEAQLKLSQYV